MINYPLKHCILQPCRLAFPALQLNCCVVSCLDGEISPRALPPMHARHTEFLPAAGWCRLSSPASPPLHQTALLGRCGTPSAGTAPAAASGHAPVWMGHDTMMAVIVLCVEQCTQLAMLPCGLKAPSCAFGACCCRHRAHASVCHNFNTSVVQQIRRCSAPHALCL